MKYIVSLHDKKNKKYGGKFDGLSLLCDEYIVPDAVCIPCDLLKKCLEAYIGNMEKFNAFFDDLESTAGCYLLDTAKEIHEMIKEFCIEGYLRDEITQELKSFISKDKMYAIRSSADHEDSSMHSFAGVYNTTLNVEGNTDVIIKIVEDAVVQYYSYSALVERIRADIYSSMIELNLIIQEMVQSEISGVAFSRTNLSGDKVLVEWIEGLGEGIVSGEKEATTYIEYEDCDRYSDVMKQIVRMTRGVQQKLGYEVDVEWAYANGTTYLLQTRPITCAQFLQDEKKPVFMIDRLYFENSIKYNNALGKCENVYEKYTQKRAFFYMQAENCGIHFGGGYVVHFNMRGITDNMDLLLSKLTRTNQVIIDVDDNIRQHIIYTHQLRDYVFDMFGKMPPNETTTIIIRQFIKGSCGVISHKIDDGKILIEYSAQGLLDMNRGLSATKHTIVDVEEEDYSHFANELLSSNMIEDIVRYTNFISTFGTKYMIEWVVFQDACYFVDFSDEIGAEYNLSTLGVSGKIIVPGNVSGRIVYLDSESVLSRLSVSPGVSVNQINEGLVKNPDLLKILEVINGEETKPVLFVDKPYAILSFLFDSVSGFVFKQCSLLCHLAILLREHNVPAIICDDFDNIVKNCSYVSIVEGQVIEEYGNNREKMDCFV